MSTIEELVALPEAELTSKFEEAVKKASQRQGFNLRVFITFNLSG